MKSKIKKFCPKCGSKLNYLGLSSANNWLIISLYTVCYDKYNKETGEIQYVKGYRCPNKRWWNMGHDSHGVKQF